MDLPGLSFAPGDRTQADIGRSLGLPVSSPNSSFALVVAFGRCKFRLEPCSVSLLLQATIGGLAHHFRVSLLCDRTFKFFVSSKPVGFFVAKLGSFSCDLFSLTFHLWGNGGPNWRRELALFLDEEDRSWQPAHKRAVLPTKLFHRAAKFGYSSPVHTAMGPVGSSPKERGAPPLSGANTIPLHASGANAIPLHQTSSSWHNLATVHNHKFIKNAHPSSEQVRPQPPAGQTFLVDHMLHGKNRQSPGDFVGDRAPTPYCQRCLQHGHNRPACKRPIRCRACFNWGHVVVNCQNLNGVRRKQGAGSSNFLAANRPPFGWFNAAVTGPSSSSPPMFSSFTEMAQALSSNPAWATRGKAPALNAACETEPNTVEAQDINPPHDHLLLSLAPPHSTAQVQNTRENPNQLLLHPPLGGARVQPTTDSMAYQRADPRPFIPDSFHWVDVPNRVLVCRAVAPTRPPANNEDLAVVTFDPLPGNVLNFGAVRNTIRQFLWGKHIHPRDILPSHLGQAFVRFAHVYERDNMVRQSPMPAGNMMISFVKHNEARNWRRVYFDDDCWVMMLGFLEDYKTERHIQNAVSEFGQLILWEESSAYPGRVMARVRVTSAQGVPQFIAYSDAMDGNGESWTIQCEVLQRTQLGNEPPEEDPIPDELDVGEHVPYDFFGLGQPVVQQGQNDQVQDQDQENQEDNQFEQQQGEQQPGEQQQDQQDFNGPNQLNPWEPWPAWPEPAQLPPQPIQPAQQVLNLNGLPLQEQDMDIDLNLDPQEVIINPVNPPLNFDFPVNDLVEVVEDNIPQMQQLDPVQE